MSQNINTTYLVGGAVAAIVCIVTTIYLVTKKSKNEKVDKRRKDSIDESSYPAGKLLIFFGSQTGTAEGFARTLMEEGKSKGFNAKVVDLEDFEPDIVIGARLGIFLMATYGEGEPTDNAMKFYRWIKNEEGITEENCLNDLRFTVFGLGNKQYEHFNRMGKHTNELLEKLGGKRVFELGLGDDDASLEEDFENWKSNLWSSLLMQFHPEGSRARAFSQDDINDKKKVTLQYTLETISKNSKVTAIRTNQMNSSTKHFFTASQAKVTVNRELCQANKLDKEMISTKHIEIDLTGTELSYETADNLAILPQNDEKSVTALCKILGYNPDEIINIKPIAGSESSFKYSFPCPCTVREALTQYFDIHGLPRHGMIAQLLPYVTDQAQSSWLKSMLQKDNRAQFKQYFEESAKSLFNLLIHELTSCKIPLVDFFHIAPFMQPRYYTISSSSSCFPTSIHITVAITRKLLSNGKVFNGLCSNFLDGLVPKSACKVFVRASSFRLPKSLNDPIILIGPGTGIAPMRALLQERQHRSKQAKGGKNTLYFGCKMKSVDYIYQNELEAFKANGTLTKFEIAFSREQDKKVYVQHLLERPDDSKEIAADIDKGAYIYICGATQMGHDVNEAIMNIIMKHKKFNQKAAADLISNLQKNGRYVQELWS